MRRIRKYDGTFLQDRRAFFKILTLKTPRQKKIKKSSKNDSRIIFFEQAAPDARCFFFSTFGEKFFAHLNF